MILFADSFDHYTAAQMPRKWSTASGLTLVAGRHGNAVKLYPSDLRHYFSDPIQTFAAGTAYMTYKYGGQPLKWWGASYPVAYLVVSADGRLQVQKDISNISAPSDFTVHLYRWYYLEMSATITLTQPDPPRYSLSYSVRVNEKTVLGGSFSNQTYSDPYARSIRPYGTFGGACHLDDFWATDGELLGDVQVIEKAALGDGTYADFTPSSPGAHYLMVDDATPDDDATYLEATAIGKKETHRFGESRDKEIKGLQYVVCVDDGGGAISEFKPLLRSGGADILGDAKDLPASYKYRRQAWRKSPFTDLDFSAEEYNALEAGVETTA